MKLLLFTLLPCVIVPPAFAHIGEATINVGRTGAGLIKVEVLYQQPLVLHPSQTTNVPGYYTGALGIHSVVFDDPFNDLFRPSTDADFSFLLLAKDPGMEVWQDGGVRFMTNGESFHIGHPVFDTHPIWNLVSGVPGSNYSLTIKFHDANGIYPDSDPIVLSFTPIAPPQLSVQDNGDDTVTVNFIGSPQEQYTVQAATNLGPAAIWRNVSTNFSDGDGFWTYTAPKSDAPQRFFRALAH